MENFIELEHVYKSFGKVHANKDICLQVRKGEILALLGENGSGKSTMVNIMAGIYSPDSGVIRVKNKVTEFHSPDDAIKNGIGMVHQHFKLVNVFSAMENIILGQKENFFIHKKDARNKILELENKYSFSIDPDKKIYSMSVSEKQTVEILKMLYQGAELLILDEPTAVLTPQETQKLFAVLRKMKEAGCSVIIITHKLNEVMEISDRVAVLRKGSYAGTVITKETNAKELADLMVGSETNLEAQWFEAKKSPKPLLSLSNVTILDQNNMKKVDSMSLEVFGGEILGVAGIVGSGQKEICEAISGLQKIESGEIYFEDRSLVSLSPRAIKKLGVRMSFIPEDRFIFVDVGDDKPSAVKKIYGELSASDILLDDYNKNLREWQSAGGFSVKMVNEINDRGTYGPLWSGNRIRHDFSAERICEDLRTIIINNN